MQIGEGTVATLAYDITTEGGEIVETSDISGPITFLHGTGALIPGLDKNCAGMTEGEEKTFSLPPEEAFGTEDTAPQKMITKAEFPSGAKLEVGSSFEAGIGGGQTITLKVASVDGDNVAVKMIHPLAGQTLGMTVRVLGVRPATKTEKEQGKAMVKPPPPPPKK